MKWRDARGRILVSFPNLHNFIMISARGGFQEQKPTTRSPQYMTLFSAPFSKASVFTYPYSLETECFQNAPLPKSLPSAFSVVLVKSIGENASKSMRFRTKTHTCGRGIKLLHANSRIIVRRRK